jgi:hypothetical protein
MALVKRLVKGSPLTFQEGDDNLQYLEDEAQKGRLYEGKLNFPIIIDLSGASDYTQPIYQFISDFIGDPDGILVRGVLNSTVNDIPADELGLGSSSDTIRLKYTTFYGSFDSTLVQGLSNTEPLWVRFAYELVELIDIDGVNTANPGDVYESYFQMESRDIQTIKYNFDYLGTDQTHRFQIPGLFALSYFADPQNTSGFISDAGLIYFLPTSRIVTDKFLLTSSDILNSGSDISLIKTTGSILIDVLSVVQKLTYNGTAYTTNTNAQIGYVGIREPLFDIDLTFTSSSLKKRTVADENFVEQSRDIGFWTNGGNPDTGDSEIELTITYQIVTP